MSLDSKRSRGREEGTAINHSDNYLINVVLSVVGSILHLWTWVGLGVLWVSEWVYRKFIQRRDE